MNIEKMNKELKTKEEELKKLVDLLNDSNGKVDKIKNLIMAGSGQIALIKKWIEEEKPKDNKDNK